MDFEVKLKKMHGYFLKLYKGYFIVIYASQVWSKLHNVNFDLYFFHPMAHKKFLELCARERALTCI